METIRPNLFFSSEEKAAIMKAIASAEHNTSGEIRLHVERRCEEKALDRAAFWFAKLNMHKTALRNGVLFYLAIEDRKFAILGDAGINAKVPENFWEKISLQMLELFKQNKFADGIALGIESAGEKLKAHFPYQADDKNELSDEISYGE